MMNYRSKAREYLKSANKQLAAGDDSFLRYAALDLRHAIESLTYDRATAYKDELPPKEFETWQPKKLMSALLEIDPTADKDSTISFGIEETYGVTPAVMQILGTDTVFNMGLLRKHYDALGSYLHVPTLKQIQKNPPSTIKIRQRCTEISIYIEKVLASPVWNSTLGTFVSIKCGLCGGLIRKRIPRDASDVIAECFECKASYKISDNGSDNRLCTPEITTVKCPNETCRHPMDLFRRELTLGTSWICQGCGGQNILTIGISHSPKIKSDAID